MKFLVFFLTFLNAVALQGQDSIVKSILFEKKEFDFGKIKEDNGMVSYEFVFKNSSKNNVAISDVKASCGCTVASYSKETIAPGNKGSIKATFDPTNRPNAFVKSLQVTYLEESNATPKVEVLLIKGFVIPRPLTLNDAFPVTYGKIRLKSEYMNLNKINTKSPKSVSFYLFNEGKSPIKITYPSKWQPHLQLIKGAEKINPKDSIQIEFNYDPKLKNDFGNVHDIIELTTSDPEAPILKLFIIANIEQYFPPMSKADSINAPRIAFDRSIHDFGKLIQGNIVETSFEISNSGKSDLIIYKTKSSCGCTLSKLEKSTLKPGEKTKLVVTFNSAGKIGEDSKAISIYSNDPTYAEGLLIIKSSIQVAQPKDSTTTTPMGK